MAQAAQTGEAMPFVDDETLRRLRGEAKPQKATRGYYTTKERWSAIGKTMKRLGAVSRNAFLDEVVSIFLTVLESKAEEDKADVLKVKASGASDRADAAKEQRGYQASLDRWKAIDAAIEKHSFRNLNYFLNAAVDYWNGFVRERVPEGQQPSKLSAEAAARLASEGAPKKSKK